MFNSLIKPTVLNVTIEQWLILRETHPLIVHDYNSLYL